ncbi:MAG: hypothetical protein E6K70_10965 [Planctomycetota bacterium]|nr:MAG: hypothetical protein E6K70_10965 [Planctomycetota bacterium]
MKHILLACCVRNDQVNTAYPDSRVTFHRPHAKFRNILSQLLRLNKGREQQPVRRARLDMGNAQGPVKERLLSESSLTA